METIYLDYNATTPIDTKVYEAMIPYLTNEYGNPSNSYHRGQVAKNAVLESRKKVATFINAQPSEIAFTSCGSESNNTAIKGVAYALREKGKHIITTQIEHPSVLQPISFLEQNGYEITYVGVDSSGKVNPTEIEDAIRPDTILISVMHSNNEVGTLQPINEIGIICKIHNILFHCDASQSAGKVPLDVTKMNVDLLTLAGHKFYAPKGIGVLYIKEGVKIEPMLHGASQESGMRAGTENVPYIVAIGKASELAQESLLNEHLKEIKSYLFNQLNDAFGDKIHLNGNFENSLPNTLNISFVNKIGSEILLSIPTINASTGSACHSGTNTISPVLDAMGIELKIALGAIRFSVGRFTTRNEIDKAVNYLKEYYA